MNVIELIKTRKSIRTFDGKEVSDNDRKKLTDYIKTITNPYNIPVEFILLDAKERGLSSPVIKGDTLYISAKAPITPHSEEAYGYSFEKLVLYAWSLGIGTTWIAGTMNRDLFEKASQVKDGERMYCISPLGYPAEKMSVKETAMRIGVKADTRKPVNELFFDGSLSKPLVINDKKIRIALEMVRLAPSAVNKQPWRIVKIGNAYHFYEVHSLGGHSNEWDVQKIDMGIALCHFMMLTNGKLSVSAPSIDVPENTEYIATVTV